ncbi:eukaryotic aspartyl protease [Teladorsagia circumcincta]|uniref:Eukaryotic aspartyl protease n=1 Tax=Teladorsagia circumcincta TaxID=45464 RepID=A0A2G9UCS4_TELCI|nr:eukaryotic aspartyl protease [Teladorsagia circumcincta]
MPQCRKSKDIRQKICYPIKLILLGGLNETAQVIPRMTFGLATTLKPLLYKDPFDGVFGLAFSNDLMPDIRPAIQQAYERKVIDKVMFTVWLPSSRLTQSGAGGAITFGDVDDDNCGPILGYAKMTDNSFYMFEVRGVSMGIYAYQEKSKVASELIGWIEGPRSVIENMAKIAGAKFDDDDGIYKIACNATPPPIVFLIGDSSYSIDYTNYIVQTSDNSNYICDDYNTEPS